MTETDFKKYNGFKVFHYKIIDSTQKEIFRRVKKGSIEDRTIINADIQTSGIGTHGRVWHTDEENNIAFSVYFDLSKMNCKIDKLDGLTVKIAEDIVKVFRKLYGINLDIKFPNDIYCNGRKLGGILTETKVQNGLLELILIRLCLLMRLKILQRRLGVNSELRLKIVK